jgi:hypothetical protein
MQNLSSLFPKLVSLLALSCALADSPFVHGQNTQNTAQSPCPTTAQNASVGQTSSTLAAEKQNLQNAAKQLGSLFKKKPASTTAAAANPCPTSTPGVAAARPATANSAQPASGTQPATGTEPVGSAGGVPSATAVGAAAPAGTKIDPIVVAPVEQGSPFAVSPLGVHVATLSHLGSRPVIVYDGVPGPKFDQILSVGGSTTGVVFSPDGNHWAYCGAQGSEWVVMRDGKEVYRSSETGGSGLFGAQALAFTSNSQHLFFTYFTTVRVYANRSDPSARFVFDEKASRPGADPALAGYVFSPDGNHVTYIVNEATDPANPKPGDSHLFVDGKEAGYSGSYPKWTSDNHLVTVQTVSVPDPKIGSVAEVLVDGHPVMRADTLKAYVPPMGDMWVAVVTLPHQQPIKSFLVVGGHQVPGSEITSPNVGPIGDVVFSPDGKHYAVVYTDSNGRSYVFSDGKKGLEYPAIQNLTFTADSSTLIYNSYDVSNGQSYLVLNGQESDRPIPIGQVVVSPVGHDVMTVATNVITRNGEPVNIPVPNPRASQLYGFSYSPDGNHYAYVLSANSVVSVVVDGVSKGMILPRSMGAPLTDIVSRPYIWSPDSKHVAYFCHSSDMTLANDVFLCVDDSMVRLGIGTFGGAMFTSDSNHLFWAWQDVRANFKAFEDGYVVAQGSSATTGFLVDADWQANDDGTFTFLLQDGQSLKRLSITPSSNSSWTKLFDGAPGATASR